jgi:hypothetical protein
MQSRLDWGIRLPARSGRLPLVPALRFTRARWTMEWIAVIDRRVALADKLRYIALLYTICKHLRT